MKPTSRQQSAAAAIFSAQTEIRRDLRLGTLTFLKAPSLSERLKRNTDFAQLQTSNQFGDIARTFIEASRADFRLTHPANELQVQSVKTDALGLTLAPQRIYADHHVVQSVKTDALGLTHVRLQQTFHDVPVWAAEPVVHLNADKQIYLVQGRYIPTPHAQSGFAAANDPHLTTARTFLGANCDLLRLDAPHAELALTRRHTDDLGRTHPRFHHKHQGWPGWPADVIVHLNPDGHGDLMNGVFVPTPKPLGTVPVLDEAAAVERARTAVPDGAQAEAAEAELIIYAPGDTPPRLAWKLEWDIALTARWLVVIDAVNGATLTAYNQITHQNPGGYATRSARRILSLRSTTIIWTGMIGIRLMVRVRRVARKCVLVGAFRMCSGTLPLIRWHVAMDYRLPGRLMLLVTN